MKLFEFFEAPKEQYQDLANDNSQPSLGELRKTKLTLKQINKLRKINDLRMYEYQESLKQVQQQYAMSAQPAL